MKVINVKGLRKSFGDHDVLCGIDEFIEKGEKVDFQEVLDDINKRDYQDSHREIAPLKQAEDALLVDNSGCNLEEGVALVMSIIKEKLS